VLEIRLLPIAEARADEGVEPRRVRVIELRRVTRPERKGPRRRVADGDGVGENPLHAGIRRERLALLDADGRQKAERFRVERVGRLFLHDRVDLLVEREVVCVNRVERLSRKGSRTSVRVDWRPARADTCAGVA